MKDYTGPDWALMRYEGRFSKSAPCFISLQPLGREHADIIHKKALYVPFYLGYGSLICCNRLHSARPKWRGVDADPGWISVCRWGENRRCLSLSACHLAVSLSKACFYTSSERGHSGLPADTRIRTIVQLIGILWSYFGVHLGSANSPLYFACHSAISWHILGYHISDERGHP